MAWWQWLLGILMFFVALGVLVGIHELGHLAMAKLFHVYCFNYSIGFGPKLLSSKRSKKHETIWTLRAIPLGGFVSMYGEGVEVEEGLYIPPSRSLEGVARYKRAIIVSAGVILNTILGFVLMVFSNLGVQTKFTFVNPNEGYESCIILSSTNNEVTTNDALQGWQDPVSGEFILSKTPVISKVSEVEKEFVFTFSNTLTYTNIDPKLSDSIVFYPKITLEEAVKKGVDGFNNDSRFGFIAGQSRADILAPLRFNNLPYNERTQSNYTNIINETKSWGKAKQVEVYKVELEKAFNLRGLTFGIDTSSKYTVNDNAQHFTITYNTYKCTGYDANKNRYTHDSTLNPHTVTLEPSGSKWKDNIGISFKRYQYHYNAGQVFSGAWSKWKNANTAIVRGLGGLFTGRGQVSGIVGIAKTSATTLANFGFAQYLYLWGMISCNLALINLLPIPGLDGWALLVTAYEGIRKKQINTKVKNIVSFIGLALLFTLMIVIIVFDVIGLIV